MVCVGEVGFGARLDCFGEVGLGSRLWIASARVGLGRGCGLWGRGWVWLEAVNCVGKGWAWCEAVNCVGEVGIGARL